MEHPGSRLGVRPARSRGRDRDAPTCSRTVRRSPHSRRWHVSNSADGRSVTSKLAAILQTFSTGNVHSLSDLARSANLPVSTAHRLTAELAEWGFLERTDDKRYRVGTLVTNLGTRVRHEPNLHEHARRILDDLSSATHATVRLGVLEDLAVSYIEKGHGTRAASTPFETRTLPAHA